MTLVNRRLALSGLFSAIALITHTTALSAQQAEQSLLRFVPNRMAHYHVPGLSLACTHNGTVEWNQAFGVARVSGDPVTPETLFQASSISMPVTAVAVLRLVEQGKLNLDVDVNQYLRSWKIPANRLRNRRRGRSANYSATPQAQPFTALRATLLDKRCLRFSRCLRARVPQILHR